MHNKLYSSEPSALCGNNFELIKNSLKAKKDLMMVPTDNDHTAGHNITSATAPSGRKYLASLSCSHCPKTVKSQKGEPTLQKIGVLTWDRT